MSDIKAGDVVELKSGGPRMTVESGGPSPKEESEGCVCCIWFDDGECLQRAVFHAECLKKHAD